MRNRQRAFTLIELLVTIAIIAILSSITIVTLNGQSAKARDARRKSDLAHLQQAIEMYYEDNGSYPVSDQYIENKDDGIIQDWQGNLYNQLVPKYISKIPLDPQGSLTNTYKYYTISPFSSDRNDLSGGGSCLDYNSASRNRYALYATLEKPSKADEDTMFGESCDNTMKASNWNSTNYRVSN